MGDNVGDVVGVALVGDRDGTAVGAEDDGDTVGDVVGDCVHPMQVKRQPARNTELLSQLPIALPLMQKSSGKVSTWAQVGAPVG